MKQKLLFFAIQTALILVVFVLLILVAGRSPFEAGALFIRGIFGSWNSFSEIMVKATPLIFTGLGVMLAFCTGFFNVGAEGQLYMGALVSAAIVLRLPVPGFVRIVLAIAAAFLVGGAWAFVPAVLKRKFGISETVNTIMFNYIALMLVGIMIRGPLQDPTSSLAQTAMVRPEASLPILLHPTRLHAGFLIALACALLVWFLVKQTTTGFEMRMCGLNQRAALCVGFPVTRSLLLSAVISGGLSGIAGMSEVLGVQHRLLEGISGGNGYTAILIALLASNHPLRVVAVSLLFAALQVGANSMQRQMGIPAAIVSIIMGFIVLIILLRDIPHIWREHRKPLETHKEVPHG